jgi:hypothetical protein
MGVAIIRPSSVATSLTFLSSGIRNRTQIAPRSSTIFLHSRSFCRETVMLRIGFDRRPYRPSFEVYRSQPDALWTPNDQQPRFSVASRAEISPPISTDFFSSGRTALRQSQKSAKFFFKILPTAEVRRHRLGVRPARTWIQRTALLPRRSTTSTWVKRASRRACTKRAFPCPVTITEFR